MSDIPSSSSSSDSETNDHTSNVQRNQSPNDSDKSIQKEQEPLAAAPDAKSSPAAEVATTKPRQNEGEDFSQFYLRQVTAALADDLDKVRAASDFNDGKVGMLIRALRQGEEIFSPEEKRRIVTR